MSLREYVRKRDFTRTAEPRGKKATPGKELRFVVQKHDATRLHYDLRLELDGTMKSWAVPKGVPAKKGDKRLAVQVEDHPLEYANFEGIIPKGEYGGGTVMVWDTGTYEPLSEAPAKELRGGKLHFLLHGKKLNGEWALVRMHGDEEKNWLLFKAGEDTKEFTAKQLDQSVLSGRTMAKIAADRDDTWHSKETASVQTLKFVEPMKARLVTAPPTGDGWIYEIKFDGFRALALKEGRHVRLLSRNNKDLSSRFPELAAAVAKLPVASAIFDGEIVALDEKGRPSFQLLQDSDNNDVPLAYYLFDLIEVDGEALVKKPLTGRKKRLIKVLGDMEDPLRLSGDLTGDPHKLLEKARGLQLEGLIGKQADSIYEIGKRSGAWIKLKLGNEQEFVIGGYTPPQGSRKHFGALLVGYWNDDDFQFAGKVGTGFNTKLLKSLHTQMSGLEQKDCPFANLPEKRGGRWSQNITPAEMRKCHWVAPKLVCQVKFTEWTNDAKLRHPVFLGLREDKAAREVIREQPAKPPVKSPAASARSKAKR